MTAGLSSLSNSARMRSSTCSAEPIWVKVPRPISAARVIRKEFGAEPMPTMNTRERPRMSAIMSNNCCSLPIAPSVRNTTWRKVVDSLRARVGQRGFHRRRHLGAAARLRAR